MQPSATTDQISGVLRIVIPVLLSFATGKGLISSDSVPFVTSTLITVITGIVTLGSIVWSIIVHQKSKQIARVAQFPEVMAVIAVPSIADAGPLKDNPKVVSNVARVP